MKQELNELGFKYIPKNGCDAWSKVYKGFVLFIVQTPDKILLSSITVGKLEICLPNIPYIDWIINFDKLNTE